jgi:hypothetical protein
MELIVGIDCLEGWWFMFDDFEGLEFDGCDFHDEIKRLVLTTHKKWIININIYYRTIFYKF